MKVLRSKTFKIFLVAVLLQRIKPKIGSAGEASRTNFGFYMHRLRPKLRFVSDAIAKQVS
ncbi:MAG: hypothetical protein WCP16_01230 [Pseudanabaena sp. ELA645]